MKVRALTWGDLPGMRHRRGVPRKDAAPRLATVVVTGQESAEGIVGQAVGKASEALQGREGGETDRPMPETLVPRPERKQDKEESWIARSGC